MKKKCCVGCTTHFHVCSVEDEQNCVTWLETKSREEELIELVKKYNVVSTQKDVTP